jgi:ribokinase
MSKIVVVGSLNMDVVAVAPRIPVAGETIIGNKYFTEPGGKGANQAYAAAKLGGKVAMLGRIGDDDFGRRMRDNVASTGCDVSGLKSVPGASGVALIFVSSSGQNCIVVVPGANGTLTAANIEAEAAALDGAGIVLLQLENPVEAVLAAARLSKQRGARVILDPAPAPAEPLPAELLATVDIVTPNETEAAILAGLPPGRLNLDQASALAAKLQAMGAPTVIMKLGEQGCLLVEAHKSTHIPAPKVTAVDTTAAGDTYNAALAVGLSEGMELVDACCFAVYASALSVTRLGTQLAVPARSEVDDFRTSAENRAGAHQA